MITALPILTPLVVVVFLLMAGKNVRWLKYTGVSGAILLFLINVLIFYRVQHDGIHVMQAGGWNAPFGITLVIDLFSAVMLLFTSFIALMVSLYALRGIDEKRHRFRFFLFFHTLMMGVNGAFIAGDIFNMYVWFEVMLISSFVLITLGSKKEQVEGAIKYVTMNLLGSFLFLAGIGLVYGKTGTLNIADVALTVRESDQSLMMNSSFILFFMAFGIKAAVFPYFFWLPSSYHTPPITVTALKLSLIKAGFEAKHFIITGVAVWVSIFYVSKVIQSNFELAFHILSPKLNMKPGILKIPIQLTNNQAILLLINLISMTPGTLTMDLTEDKKFIYVHFLFLFNEEQKIEEIKNLEMKIFS